MCACMCESLKLRPLRNANLVKISGTNKAFFSPLFPFVLYTYILFSDMVVACIESLQNKVPNTAVLRIFPSYDLCFFIQSNCPICITDLSLLQTKHVLSKILFLKDHGKPEVEVGIFGLELDGSGIILGGILQEVQWRLPLTELMEALSWWQSFRF